MTTAWAAWAVWADFNRPTPKNIEKNLEDYHPPGFFMLISGMLNAL
jgi:hypothetical protein